MIHEKYLKSKVVRPRQWTPNLKIEELRGKMALYVMDWNFRYYRSVEHFKHEQISKR